MFPILFFIGLLRTLKNLVPKKYQKYAIFLDFLYKTRLQYVLEPFRQFSLYGWIIACSG